MGSDNNNIDLEGTSLTAEIKKPSPLAGNPVSDFEDSRKSMLQKSLASANNLLQSDTLQSSTPLRATFPQAAMIKPLPAVSPEPQQTAPHHHAVPAPRSDDIDEENNTGWASIASGLKAFGKAMPIVTKKLYQADWNKIGNKCLSAIGYACDMAAKGIAFVAAHPRETVDLAIQGLKIAGGVLLNIGKAALEEGYNLITHPIDTLKRFGSFLKGFSDTVGLTDLAAGGYHFALCIGSMAVLNFSAAKKHGEEATRSIAGAIKAVGEITGISDIGRACIALSKDEYGKAAIFGTLGATQLYVVCTTLGLGNLLSKSGIEAAKKGIRILSQNTAREVVAEVEKKISNKVLHTTGEKIANISAELVLGNWPEVAKNLFQGVKNIVKDTAEKIVEKLLRENGVKETVTAATDKLLEKISRGSVKDLAKEFTERGVSASEAKYMAKCLKKALWKEGRCSRYHGILAEEIIDEISDQLNENLMERGLRAGFESGWKKQVARIVKLKGLDEESAEIMLKAGREGFAEGVELAVRKVVREGVEASFKKYRKFDFDLGLSDGEIEDIKYDKFVQPESEKVGLAPRKKTRINKYRVKRPDEDEVIRDIDGNVKIQSKDPDSDKKYLEI
jgi:hypothetical protein